MTPFIVTEHCRIQLCVPLDQLTLHPGFLPMSCAWCHKTPSLQSDNLESSWMPPVFSALCKHLQILIVFQTTSIFLPASLPLAGVKSPAFLLSVQETLLFLCLCCFYLLQFMICDAVDYQGLSTCRAASSSHCQQLPLTWSQACLCPCYPFPSEPPALLLPLGSELSRIFFS